MRFVSLLAAMVAVVTTVAQAQELPATCETCIARSTVSIKSCAGLSTSALLGDNLNDQQKKCFCDMANTDSWAKDCFDQCPKETLVSMKAALTLAKIQSCPGGIVTPSTDGNGASSSSKKAGLALGVAAIAAHVLF
ncbi:hypothetical protein BGZ94_005239 [Podila epigama]|nr:hypothetical protein BGZ94_005239 [Podila epigama]